MSCSGQKEKDRSGFCSLGRIVREKRYSVGDSEVWDNAFSTFDAVLWERQSCDKHSK